jgi:hypothetical protein
MKKVIEKEVEFCDVCTKEMDYGNRCLICGKAMCYECRKVHMTTFNHAIGFSGSDAGD